MQAITTEFRGYRFRSRLEARWAVFFDTLGLDWTYEPEGFNLDGDWYLPDFWIDDWQAWVEIKPENVKAATMRHSGDPSWILCNKLADSSGKRVLLIQGQPWIDSTDLECPWERQDHWVSLQKAGGDLNKPEFDLVKFSFAEQFSNAKYSISAFLHTPPWFDHEMEEKYPSYSLNGWIFGRITDDERIYLCHSDWPSAYDMENSIGSDIEILDGVNPFADPLIEAFTAARSARFEHGEQGYWAP
jgi:hypothetical protein